MDRESIKEFLRDIQGPNVKIKDQGQWVSSSCPFAQWTHAHGTDNNVSFGIKVEDNGASGFSCFSCHEKGSLKYLLSELSYYTGEDYSAATQMVDTNDYLSVNLPSWSNRKIIKPSTMAEPLDPSIVDLYDSAIGHPYIKSRGIDNNTAELLNLRVDPNNKGVERILFPVYGVDRNLYGFSGRATVKGVEPRVRDYFGLKKESLLLGSHLVDKSAKFIILVEGLFDYAKITAFGYTAIAAMHSTLTSHQANILIGLGIPVVVFFDNDVAGQEGVQKVKAVLQHHIPLSKVKYPARLSRGGRSDKMDPCSLTEQQVYDMVVNRRVL